MQTISTDESPLVVDVPGAAAIVGVGKTTIYGFIRTGQLPTIKIGRRTVIRRAACEALLDRLESEQAQAS